MHIDNTLLDRMAQKRMERLAEALADELTLLYPKECRRIGRKNLESFCKITTQKSYSYGAKTYSELRDYIEIAWVLGVGFDVDPLYPWIEDIFRKEEPFEYKLEEAREKVYSMLYFNTIEELQAFKKALDRLLQVDLHHISTFTNYQQVIQELENIYPERVKMLGGAEHIKNALKIACHGKAVRYNINHPIGIFAYASLVFFLGHKVDNDPLHGSVKIYLNDDEPNMALKLDKINKVIKKRIRGIAREINKLMETKYEL